MRETLGMAGYEYLMQIRRIGLWVSLLPMTGLVYFFILKVPVKLQEPGAAALLNNPWKAGANLVYVLNFLAPVAAGILVADRFTRDRQLKVDEVLRAALPSSQALAPGKFLGSLLAVLTPALLVVAGAVSFTAVQFNEPLLLLTAPLAFLAIALPSWMFAVAWSLAFPLVLPLRIYQILYAGFWLWAVAVTPQRLPTINQSALSIDGSYAQQAFFLQDPDPLHLHPPATIGWASFNMALIVGLTLLALALIPLVLRWQERRI